jgi:hypothetical protein
MFGDDAGLFDDALFLDADDEANELGHAPSERGGTAGARAEKEPGRGWLGAVPDLFGEELLLRLSVSKAGELKPFEAVLHVKVTRGVPVDTTLIALHRATL